MPKILPSLTNDEKTLLRQKWGTPDDFFSVINAEFAFSVDVAADKQNTKCDSFIGEGLDALGEDTNWFWPHRGSRAFCNPGFANLYSWMHKAFHEVEQDHAEDSPVACVMGLPSSSTVWWDFARRYAHEIRLLRPRVQYVAPDPRLGKSTNDRECVMVVFRKLPMGDVWPGAKIWTWNWKDSEKCLVI